MARGAGTWGRLARVALSAVVDAAVARPRRRPARQPARRPTAPSPRGAGGSSYPGDFTGVARIEYRPSPDGDADPGEIVWGWVPYEEDATRGKDRPALVVARDGRWVLALMLTSKDHDAPGGAPDRRSGGSPQRWLDIGTGAWDARGRPSEVRLDRVLRLDPETIRREGAVLERRRFDEVAAALRSLHGWS